MEVVTLSCETSKENLKMNVGFLIKIPSIKNVRQEKVVRDFLHKKISRYFSLPPPLFTFYFNVYGVSVRDSTVLNFRSMKL